MLEAFFFSLHLLPQEEINLYLAAILIIKLLLCHSLVRSDLYSTPWKHFYKMYTNLNDKIISRKETQRRKEYIAAIFPPFILCMNPLVINNFEIQ